MSVVRVGIGVILTDKQNNVLIGKRSSSLAPYYSIPGGHMELGETFEYAASREIKEETDLTIFEPRVIAITNNLATFDECGKHYISVIVLAQRWEGELKRMEPDKCAEWRWVDPQNLPKPHFDASEKGVACYLQSQFYVG